MRFKRPTSLLEKKARKRPRLVGTVAFYGPDMTRASKVVVGVVAEDDTVIDMKKWFSEKGDLRHDRVVAEEMAEFMKLHGVKSVATTGEIMGCPHEEGIDYEEGQVCPQCPFWANRERWSGDLLQ